MKKERNWRREYRNLKFGLKKRAVFVLLVVIGCLLTSCQQQRTVVRERIVALPQVKIDTTYRFIKDTVFRIETDSILIETIIRDTLIEQHIETKPLYITVRDTIFDAKTERAKEQNKWLKEENKRLKKADEKARKSSAGWVIAYTLGAAVTIGWLWTRKRKD